MHMLVYSAYVTVWHYYYEGPERLGQFLLNRLPVTQTVNEPEIYYEEDPERAKDLFYEKFVEPIGGIEREIGSF